MKKVLLAVFGLILVAGIATGAVAASGGEGKNINVDASHSGEQVQLSVGESLVVTLASNATTGYSWTLDKNSDEGVLHESGHEYIAPNTTLVGAGGKEVWTFKAIKKGTSTISMEYSRPWEEGIPPVETFDLTVVVN